MNQNIHIFFSKRLSILAWAALLLTMVGQAFGAKYWIAELLTHFVPHAGVTLLLASIVFPREGLKYPVCFSFPQQQSYWFGA